jgi:hypothetical protein
MSRAVAHRAQQLEQHATTTGRPEGTPRGVHVLPGRDLHNRTGERCLRWLGPRNAITAAMRPLPGSAGLEGVTERTRY